MNARKFFENSWKFAKIRADSRLSHRTLRQYSAFMRNVSYYIAGDLEIVMPDGSILRETRAAFCRCGASNNKPFCDNSHREIPFRDDGLREAEPNASDELPLHQTLRITPRPNGSLRLDGAFELRDAFGQVVARRTEARLCRCGASADKPFCDSVHKQIGFQTEANET